MEARKVVVVTGASAGVGRATALEFARRGADVALLARGKEGLDSARRDVEAAGARAVAVLVDVADPGAVEAAAEKIESELGSIDVWVNNAMLTVFGEFLSLSEDEFRRVTEVTYLGCVYGTRAALRRMTARDCGAIVQVVFAARHGPRELYVGASTPTVVVGNKFFPGLGDWYLARTGYASQKRSGVAPHPGEGNLWEPRDKERDFGARGPFSTRAHSTSWQLWIRMHKGIAAAVGVGLIAGALAALHLGLRR